MLNFSAIPDTSYHASVKLIMPVSGYSSCPSAIFSVFPFMVNVAKSFTPVMEDISGLMSLYLNILPDLALSYIFVTASLKSFFTCSRLVVLSIDNPVHT